MSRVRRAGTAPELRLRSGLWRAGLRFRVQLRVEGVRPDIVFTRRRIAVFVDGCFWHGCPDHGSIPATNREFWASKLATNSQRDARQTAILEAAGWTVLRYWEHEVTADVEEVVSAISMVLSEFETESVAAGA